MELIVIIPPRASAPATPEFLWSQPKTQIDEGEVTTHAKGTAVPSPPSVSVGTSVIAETPVSKTTELSVPTVPSVSPETALTAFRVFYDGNDNDSGTAPVDTTYYAKDSNAKAAGAGTLAKEDHSFDGWNTAADGSGTAYAPDDDITMTAPVTLYAQWIAT